MILKSTLVFSLVGRNSHMRKNYEVKVCLFLQTDEGWEEFFDYIFPEDEATKPNLKLLASAKAWKRKQEDSTEEDAQNES